MNDEWEEIQSAVATKPLDEALQYIICELKTDILRARAGVALLGADDITEVDSHEVCMIVEASLVRTLEVIRHLMIDRYLPRLRPQQEQPD